MDELTHQEILLLFHALHCQAHEHSRIIDRLVAKLRSDVPEHRYEDTLANDEQVLEHIAQRRRLKTLATKLLELSTPANNKEA